MVCWEILTVNSHTQPLVRWVHHAIAVVSTAHTLVLTCRNLIVVIWR